MRGHPAARKVPFILLTGRGDRELVVKAAQAGANNYLVKPFTADILRQKIEQVMGNACRNGCYELSQQMTSDAADTVQLAEVEISDVLGRTATVLRETVCDLRDTAGLPSYHVGAPADNIDRDLVVPCRTSIGCNRNLSTLRRGSHRQRKSGNPGCATKAAAIPRRTPSHGFDRAT